MNISRALTTNEPQDYTIVLDKAFPLSWAEHISTSNLDKEHTSYAETSVTLF